MTGEEPGEGLFADAREEDDKINPLRLWPAHNVLDVSIVCRDIDTGTARTAGCPFVSRGGGMWRDFVSKASIRGVVSLVSPSVLFVFDSTVIVVVSFETEV